MVLIKCSPYLYPDRQCRSSTQPPLTQPEVDTATVATEILVNPIYLFAEITTTTTTTITNNILLSYRSKPPTSRRLISCVLHFSAWGDIITIIAAASHLTNRFLVVGALRSIGSALYTDSLGKLCALSGPPSYDGYKFSLTNCSQNHYVVGLFLEKKCVSHQAAVTDQSIDWPTYPPSSNFFLAAPSLLEEAKITCS